MLAILAKENGHEHGVYLSPSGLGQSSPEGRDKHVHNVVMDETTGQWVVEAGGKDLHTHEIREIERTPQKLEKESEDSRVEEVLSLVKEAETVEGDSIKKGIESYGYYFGDGQWDEEGKRRLEANNRAAITVNEIEHRIDVLCGTHSQNKTDVLFRPVEDGDTQAADLANILYKSVMSQNSFHREDGLAFRDAVVTGRGCKTVEIDFDDNIEGDIRIRWFPFDKVRFGPHERIDQEDMEYLVKFDNFSKGKLKSLFPDKADEIEFSFRKFEGFDDELRDAHKNIAGLAYRLSKSNVANMSVDNAPIVDVAKKEFKVFEVWQKMFRNIDGFIIPEDNFVDDSDGMSKKDIAKLKKIPGIVTVQKRVCDIRKTEMAGGVILSDQILDLPVNTNVFHLFTSYGKKHKNKFIGKVEPAKGLQNTINKLTSQTIDITNKMAAYGWFYDNETFEHPSEGDKFRRTSAQAGFTQKVRDTSRPPVQVQGVKFPSELVNLKADATTNLDSIMGVPARASEYSGDLTAKMFLLTKRQSLVGNDFLFENNHLANKKMAKLIISYIQALYTPERIKRVIGTQNEEDLHDLSDPNVVNLTEEEIAQILNNEDLLKLDLVMSESAHTDTMKELTFMTLQEVMQTIGGDPTILRHWIKNSPFPNKSAILMEMEQAQAAASQAGNDTNDSQTFASLPDSVKEELARSGIYSYKDLNVARELEQQQNSQGEPGMLPEGPIQ